VVAAMVVALFVISRLPEDRFDRGIQVSLMYLGMGASVLVLAVWYFAFASISWATRGITALLLVLGGMASLAAIRRIDFTGDMRPVFEFRWQPNRDQLLTAHRTSLATDDDLPPIQLDAIRETDMAEYRGQRRDGVVTGPPLARDWTARPPEVIWREPVGGGYAALSVAGNVAVTIEQRGENEAVVCYDPASGRERWIYDYPAKFSEPLGGVGPRATTTIAGGKVYALGGTGVLTCLDVANGAHVWTRNVLTLSGAKNLQWGMAGSPLVFDGKVIVSPGGQGAATGRAVLALDAGTGELIWSIGDAQGAYASPMLARLDNVQQLIIFDAEGVAGFDLDGRGELWRYPWKTPFDNSAAQPVVLPGDRVLITSDNGCALLKINRQDDTWSVEPLWTNKLLKGAYANPIARDGFVYGLDKGILVCLDLKTGRRRWKQGRHGHGQMLLADDLLVILSEKGHLVLVEATPDAYRELGKIPAIEGRTWNNPTMVEGRIFVRNHLEMACYDLHPLETEEARTTE